MSTQFIESVASSPSCATPTCLPLVVLHAPIDVIVVAAIALALGLWARHRLRRLPRV